MSEYTIHTKGGQSLAIAGKNGGLSWKNASGDILISCENWLGANFFVNNGETPPEPVQSLSYNVSAETGALAFTAESGGAALIGKFTPQEWGFELALELKNMSGRCIHDVRINLENIRAGADAAFAVPHLAGYVVPVSGLEEGQSIGLHYPVFSSMQWLDVFNNDHGVYFGICDTKAKSKKMAVGVKNGAPFIETVFTDLLLEDGGSLCLPPVQLMAHDGDWRAGADHYGKWFRSVFTRKPAPEWCRKNPFWAWALCKQQHAETPSILYNQLPEISEKVAKAGIQTLQVSGYMEKGHDTLFPDYTAGASLGGDEGLISCIGKIHENGGKLALYTNARLADPASSIGGKDGWTEWCVSGRSLEQLKNMSTELRLGVPNPSLHPSSWDEKGVCYKSTYGEVEFAVMCPSSPEWQDLFVDKITELVSRYRPDGVYFDQICGAWGLVCYHQGHGHKSPSDAWYGYVSLTERLNAAVKAQAPDAYLSTEGVNDILGLHIDIFQAHNSDFGFGLPSCARQTPDIFIRAMPDYLLYLGPASEDTPAELRRAFVYGRGLDTGSGGLIKGNADSLREMLFTVKSRTLLCPELLSAIPEPVLEDAGGVYCFSFKLPVHGFVVLGVVLDTAEDNTGGTVKLPELPELIGNTLLISTPLGEKTVRYEGGAIEIDRDAGMWMITIRG